MATVLLVIHLMIAAALVGIVLLQRSEGGALGIGSGGGFMTGRGTSNLLTRVTAGLAAAFFVTSLALTLIASRPTQRSILDLGSTSQPAKSDEKAAPAAPEQPKQPSGGGGILDKLQPPGPSGPRVPQSK
jgi:preprotein translocase subunit SecG